MRTIQVAAPRRFAANTASGRPIEAISERSKTIAIGGEDQLVVNDLHAATGRVARFTLQPDADFSPDPAACIVGLIGAKVAHHLPPPKHQR